MPVRRRFVIGNWKMFKTTAESLDYARELLKILQPAHTEIGLAIPFTSIAALAQLFSDTPVMVGAQNMHDAEEGAFTGEISALMLQDAGAQFVLLGHSERRHVFGEGNAFINRKVKQAFHAGLLPVVCVGETLEQRESNATEQVLSEQLSQSLQDLSENQVGNLVIAYEPVWAIGTGKTASPEQAESAHAYCRGVIASKWGAMAAQKVSILYGGSVKPDNAGQLMARADIDGLLVGGASLNPKVFNEIVNVCK